MSKYEALRRYLAAAKAAELPMTFAEIEAVLGAGLPRSAYEHREWWANESQGSHVQARAWMDAGFETASVNKQARTLVFRRAALGAAIATPRGMEEKMATYSATNAATPRRNPLFGAMKGTFWTDPNWDLTQSSLAEAERDAWEASLDRKAASIEVGGGRKP